MQKFMECFCSFLLGALISFAVFAVLEDENPKNQQNNTATKFEYNGHIYIKFGHLPSGKDQAIVHDPDCCCK